MECPRCGEDNLPGLKACLGCGQDLDEDPADLQLSTLPRVRAGNPLDRPKPLRPRRPRFLVSAQDVLLLQPLLSACLLGLVPGLGPILREDRRTAAILVSLFLACGLLWVLLWRSPLQPFAWMAALSVMASGALTEARVRIPGRGILWSMAATGFAVAMALSVHVIVSFAFDTFLPRVVLPDQQALAGGHFLVERVRAEDLARDELVALGQRQTFWQLAGEPVVVGPVLGLPGERVESDEDGLWIDGEPVLLHPPNPNVAPPLLPEGGIEVPEGQVAVMVATIRVLPAEELLGRLHYRWLPQAERGPFRWPPPEADPVLEAP